ncbi:MAG: hypothetical protein CML33_02325 [Rhodobacteraceae bacterium]|nr:hypothetical protein [Paracoccaceae bacterium]|tara:strand:- start:1247 stop:1504 length:258 start_codon:yes stop_codon:yes gene_type:complete
MYKFWLLREPNTSFDLIQFFVVKAFSVEDFAVQWFHKASMEYVFYKLVSIDPRLRAAKSKIFSFIGRFNFIAFGVLLFKLTSVIP